MKAPPTPASMNRRLAEVRYKYSYRGRLERYCRGRLAILPIRIGYQTAGSVLVAAFGNWKMGAGAFAFCLAGEVLELLTIQWARRRDRIRRRPRLSGRVVALGSLAWAMGMSGGVTMLWSVGGAEYWFLSLVFLFSALVNAQLVGGLHGPSLVVKQTIMAITGVSVLAGTWSAVHEVEQIAVFALAALVMGLTLWGLFVRIDMQNRRRHEAEFDLINAQIDLERANGELIASDAKLRRHVERAETLAFDSQAETRSKSKFLARMSNDIRTPMVDLIDLCDRLKDTARTDEQKEIAGTMTRSSRALLSIIDNLLDLTLVEAGRLTIGQARFGLGAFWDGLVAGTKPIVTESGLEFLTSARIAGEVDLVGDVDRLRQILQNLLDHAVSVTRSGHVGLGLSTRAMGRKLGVTFSVTDTGPGIPKSQIARIFEAHQPSEGATGEAIQGNPLGLAIAQRLARLMKGDVTVQSELGRGTTFTLFVPLTLARTADSGAARGAQAAAELGLEGLHILIVEDSRADALLLEKLIRPTGAELCFATDGEEAVRTYINALPDVVLMDVYMPHKDGLAATGEIRGLEARAGRARCPIVVLTSDALAEDRKRCLEAGADAVVIKPVTRAGLYATLRNVMSHASAD